jgi:putative endonuclease
VTRWFVYIVRCRDGSLYTGITTDVPRRLAQHRGSDGRGARYLRGKRPLRLVFRKTIGSRGLALRVESRIKALARDRKERLIRQDRLLGAILAEARKTMPRGLIARGKPSRMTARHG